MRFALLITFVCVLFPIIAFAAVDTKREPMPTPLMRTVEPYSAKAGTEVLVSGDNLGSKLVLEVYLSLDGKNTKAVITSQTDKEVKFTVPKVSPGSYRIVVLLNSPDPVLIEEPVKLIVEE